MTKITIDDIWKKLAEVFGKHFDIPADDLSLGARLRDDYGADSLDLQELAIDIENAYEIEIPDDVWDNVTTLGEAIRVVARALETKGVIDISQHTAEVLEKVALLRDAKTEPELPSDISKLMVRILAAFAALAVLSGVGNIFGVPLLFITSGAVALSLIVLFFTLAWSKEARHLEAWFATPFQLSALVFLFVASINIFITIYGPKIENWTLPFFIEIPLYLIGGLVGFVLMALNAAIYFSEGKFGKLTALIAVLGSATVGSIVASKTGIEPAINQGREVAIASLIIMVITLFMTIALILAILYIDKKVIKDATEKTSLLFGAPALIALMDLIALIQGFSGLHEHYPQFEVLALTGLISATTGILLLLLFMILAGFTKNTYRGVTHHVLAYAVSLSFGTLIMYALAEVAAVILL